MIASSHIRNLKGFQRMKTENKVIIIGLKNIKAVFPIERRNQCDKENKFAFKTTKPRRKSRKSFSVRKTVDNLKWFKEDKIDKKVRYSYG